MPSPRHVALYMRISRSDERGDVATTSIVKQRNNTRRLAGARYPSLRVVEYVDDGISASKGRARAGLDAMLADVRAERVEAVIVDTLDRIDRGRGAATLWGLAEACELSRTALLGASQDIDLGTSSGELSASIMAAAARYEARRTADRVKATNALRASLGLRHTGGNIVWGLKRGQGDEIVPDPERAPILLDIVDRVIEGTLTVRAAVRELTARGVPTARGASAWSHAGLSKVLRSPALAGMTPTSSGVLHGPDGFPFVHPGALLTLERFNALQAALDERARTRGPGARSTALPLLHGLLVDSEGHRLYRRVSKPGHAARYACNKPHCEAFASASTPALDALVLDAFRAEVGDEDELTARIVIPGRDTARLNRIRADIGRTTAELTSAREVDVIQELAARLGVQRQAEAEVEKGSAHGDVKGFVKTGRSLREALDAAVDDASRRALLVQHVERVVLRRAQRSGPRAPLESRVDVLWLA